MTSEAGSLWFSCAGGSSLVEQVSASLKAAAKHLAGPGGWGMVCVHPPAAGALPLHKRGELEGSLQAEAEVSD